MTSRQRALCAALLSACLAGGVHFVAPAQADQVINVPGDDVEMNAAIAKARETLPGFWAHLAKPAKGEEHFSLKLQFTDGDKSEHFWCGNIEGDAAAATCVIDNEPEVVKTVKAGERVKVDPARISDWMLTKDNKIIGGQTIRVLLPKLDKAQADALRAALSDETLSVP